PSRLDPMSCPTLSPGRGRPASGRGATRSPGRACSGSSRFLSVLHDHDEVRDLRDHAADRRIVGTRHDAVQLLEAERAQRRLLRLVEADPASDLLDRDRLLGGAHRVVSRPSSWTSLPRRFATVSALRGSDSPAIVARSTFWGLALPRDFVRMSCTPAASSTARTA